jgi:hypothetical protein
MRWAFLDQAAFARVAEPFSVDMKRFAQDAKRAVIRVQRSIYDGCNHALWIVLTQSLFDDAFARARFAHHHAKATLLAVYTQRLEDFLLMRQQAQVIKRKGILFKAKMSANHRLLPAVSGLRSLA